VQNVLGPYYKNELGLKSNSSEILPVNCKFNCNSTPIKLTKLKLEALSLIVSTKRKEMNTDQLAINWQNFTRVWLQLEFAFILQP